MNLIIFLFILKPLLYHCSCVIDFDQSKNVEEIDNFYEEHGQKNHEIFHNGQKIYNKSILSSPVCKTKIYFRYLTNEFVKSNPPVSQNYYKYYKNAIKRCNYDPESQENNVISFDCEPKVDLPEQSCIIDITEISARENELWIEDNESYFYLNTYLKNGDAIKYSCLDNFHKVNNHPRVCNNGKFDDIFRCKYNKFYTDYDHIGSSGNQGCFLGSFLDTNIKKIVCSDPNNTDLPETEYSSSDKVEYQHICKSICVDGTYQAFINNLVCDGDFKFNYLKCVDNYEIEHNTLCKLPGAEELKEKGIDKIYLSSEKFELLPGAYIDDQEFRYTCLKSFDDVKKDKKAKCILKDGNKTIQPVDFGCKMEEKAKPPIECYELFNLVDGVCVKKEYEEYLIRSESVKCPVFISQLNNEENSCRQSDSMIIIFVYLTFFLSTTILLSYKFKLKNMRGMRIRMRRRE